MAVAWIDVCPDSPYFITGTGNPWTPIGQNDAIEWADLNGLFRRRDLAAVRSYFHTLSDAGVTVLRLMLEYCHHEHRYFEKPVGTFPVGMLRLWDDLFALCEEFGMRLLLTPFDSFWMWKRWRQHPYNARNGGPCAGREQLYVCQGTRDAVKRRLDFVTRRWGASGVIFAWDLWNELHPAYGLDSVEHAREFITEIGTHLRATEMEVHGRAHLQTASVFLPLLDTKPTMAEIIYRHPGFDFASTHFYEEGTIDHPRDTVQPAISTGNLVRLALDQIPLGRPFFDSEHGPIHTFKDHRRSLPEPFDDEYFRHMQWAHFASGAAGGAMRWPNRHPHRLTPGMRRAQKALAGFVPLIDWTTFRRRNWNESVQVVSAAPVAAFACGDAEQAVLWVLRKAPLLKNGMIDRAAEAIDVELSLPWRSAEDIRITAWDTSTGTALPGAVPVRRSGDTVVLSISKLTADRAFALRENVYSGLEQPSSPRL